MLGHAIEHLACTETSQAASNFRADKAPGIDFSATLKLAGIEFIDENCGGPGLRLRKRPRAKPSKRQMAPLFICQAVGI